MRKIAQFVGMLLILPVMTACGIIFEPAVPTAALPTDDLMQTAIFLVSQTAELKQATPPPTGSQTPAWPATHTPHVTATSMFAQTPTPESTSIPTIERSATRSLVTLTPNGKCNSIGQGPIFDITIPDGTELLPGQTFTKTWRLINTGTCKWSRLYKLVFYSGNPMGAHQQQLFGGEVLPGQAVDISVDFSAPSELGIFQSNWMLMDGEGNLFGMGWNADAPFWANIYVVEELSPTPIP